MTVPQPFPWQREAAQRWLATPGTHHAWLLTAPAGHGISEFAHALGAAWLCDGPNDGAACGTCESCRWLATGAHPDLKIVKPEEPDKDKDTLTREEIKVDAIRALAEWAVSTAHRKRKVVVVDSADVLNLQAANALLKLLEEPPSAVRFFLTSADKKRLPATIASRCVNLDLPPTPFAEAKRWLEGQNVPSAQIALLLAQAGDAPLAALARADASIQAARTQFLDALSQPQSLSALVLGDALDAIPKLQKRQALSDRLHWLASWMHDALVVAEAGAPRFNPDYHTALRSLAKTLHKVQGFRYYANLIGRIGLIQHPLSARLVLEDALMDYKRIALAGNV